MSIILYGLSQFIKEIYYYSAFLNFQVLFDIFEKVRVRRRDIVRKINVKFCNREMLLNNLCYIKRNIYISL